MTTSLQPNRNETTSSFMLEALFRSVPVLVEGVRTNFFGLGCPIYCAQPGVASLLLALVIRGLLGFCSCLLVLWTFWTHLRSDLPAPSTWCPPSSTTSPSRYYSALAGYLNERGPTLCTTAAAYWRIIGDLANSDSISHSFPSELEARTYLAGAENFRV